MIPARNAKLGTSHRCRTKYRQSYVLHVPHGGGTTDPAIDGALLPTYKIAFWKIRAFFLGVFASLHSYCLFPRICWDREALSRSSLPELALLAFCWSLVTNALVTVSTKLFGQYIKDQYSPTNHQDDERHEELIISLRAWTVVGTLFTVAFLWFFIATCLPINVADNDCLDLLTRNKLTNGMVMYLLISLGPGLDVMSSPHWVCNWVASFFGLLLGFFFFGALSGSTSFRYNRNVIVWGLQLTLTTLSVLACRLRLLKDLNTPEESDELFLRIEPFFYVCFMVAMFSFL